MTKFSEARLTTEAEANALADVACFASQLPGDGPATSGNRPRITSGASPTPHGR